MPNKFFSSGNPKPEAVSEESTKRARKLLRSVYRDGGGRMVCYSCGLAEEYGRHDKDCPERRADMHFKLQEVPCGTVYRVLQFEDYGSDASQGTVVYSSPDRIEALRMKMLLQGAYGRGYSTGFDEGFDSGLDNSADE